MADESLTAFIDSVCGAQSRLRIEQDFGGGYVRLRSSEAEKRQAAQDIRSTEDVVIELFRNARDANARNIFLALLRDEQKRVVTMIDDGDGIPSAMHEKVFEPRVTSKLDTAHMDKWGMHGRGMALYSIAQNAENACVRCSDKGIGTAIVVETSLEKLGEKTDQSTFPRFEVKDGVHVMRGPRNILRTAVEFALEHRRDCRVFCGSATDIAATLYAYGLATTSPAARAFGGDDPGLAIVKRLATASDPASFASKAEEIGLRLSERSARRIMEGAIRPAPSLLERLEAEAFPDSGKKKTARRTSARGASDDRRGLKIDPADLQDMEHAVSAAYQDLAKRYYLQPNASVDITVSAEEIRLTIPIEKIR